MNERRNSPILSIQVVEATLTGVGRHAVDLCDGLLDLGHQVVLFCASERMDRQFSERLERLMKRTDFQRIDCPMQRSIGPSDIRAIHQVYDFLAKQSHTKIVCHGHSSKGGAIARLAAAKARVSAVYTPNAISSMNPKAAMWKRVSLARLERWLAQRGKQRLIATSRDEFEHLRDFVRIPDRIVQIVPNGIASRQLPTSTEARESLGLPLDRLIFGFVGRMASQKGLDVLMRAWTSIRQQFPTALLALIGTGPLEQELKQQAKLLGHGDSIAWLGEKPGETSMPAFDVFVLPSRYEGLPYVLMEALAAGLPIVVTDKASAGQVVEDGTNGFIVRCEDDKHLASKMTQIIRDDGIRQRFAAASLRRAGLFTAERMVEDVVKLYEELLSDR
ncbi:MAG: glycosyltransferase family 4 protein [Pirellulaceae bacterium]|nr:glycosyltransferase family 4 protein [Pirellulaceae bacterium]